MQLFRAIPASRVKAAAQGLQAQQSIRVPSNVPYVVDNIWETLRPADMPSRRHAIYASPTPALALQNASAPVTADDHYVACEVIVNPAHIRVAQLQVVDAKVHPDIKLVSGIVSRIGNQLAKINMQEKICVAPFFMPGLSKIEMEEITSVNALIYDIFMQIKEKSTFWLNASPIPNSSNGELFFELIGNSASYRLVAV